MRYRYWIYLGVFVLAFLLVFVGLGDGDAPGVALAGFIVIIVLGVFLMRDLIGRGKVSERQHLIISIM